MLKKISLIFILLLFINLITIYINRSLWIDEAMILVAVYNTDYLRLFYPLEYYTQAQPVILNYILKLILQFTSNLILIRLTLFIINFSVFFLLLRKLKKLRNYNYYWTILVVLIFFPTMMYYSTELKHYFAEFLVTFSVIIMFFEFEKSRNYKTYFFGLTILSAFGFSTLIPIGIFLVYGWLTMLFNEYSFSFQGIYKLLKDRYGLLIISSLIFVVSAGHMVFVTSYQLQNPAYLNDSIIQSLLTLIYVSIGVFSLNGIALVISSVLFVLLRQKNDEILRLVLIFMSVVIVVSLGKITNVYPILSTRHLVWLIPFGLTFILDLIYQFINDFSYSGVKRIVFTIVFVLSFSISALRGSLRTNQVEVTNNDSLYNEVLNMASNEFVVDHYALPSLKAYQFLDNELSNFDFIYFDWSNNIVLSREAGLRNTIGLLDNSRKYTMIVSHFDILNLRDHLTQSTLLVFEEYSINYEIVFVDKNVSILEISFNLD